MNSVAIVHISRSKRIFHISFAYDFTCPWESASTLQWDEIPITPDILRFSFDRAKLDYRASKPLSGSNRALSSPTSGPYQQSFGAFLSFAFAAATGWIPYRIDAPVEAKAPEAFTIW